MPAGGRYEPRQRETCSRVIELRIRPRRCAVALFARCGEACMRHRRCCVVEVRLVAGNAGRHRDVVVVVDVTVRARPRRDGMQPRQRKSRRRVIELRIRPQHGVVALFARSGEARMRHWRRRVVEIGLVARNAGRHRDVVVVVLVAVGADARWIHVRAYQREARR